MAGPLIGQITSAKLRLRAAVVEDPGGDQQHRLDERHSTSASAGTSEPGSTIQRISSSTPTIGLSPYNTLVRVRDVAERIDDRRDE